MRVLVACEFSGIVRDAFVALGHSAWSCDLIASERPGRHLRCDIRDVLDSYWDLMIAHPPCTYLACSGARWWKGREREQAEALDFVRLLLAAPIDRIALENPPGAIGSHIRSADQYIQPWEHGHGETKRTGLWLKNLPLLRPSQIVPGRATHTHRESPSALRSRNRSRTFPGIARAMAAQWAPCVRRREPADN